MIWYVIFGVFAAFGALCALWVFFGVFLPGSRGCTAVVLCKPGQEEAVLRRYHWLRELGLARCRLILLDSHLPPEKQQFIMEKYRGVEFTTLAQWRTGEEQERGEID